MTAKKEPARKRGRPTKYTKALADKIAVRLASGESLRAICRDEDMPQEPTVRSWALDDREGFFAQYTRARTIQAHHIFDETLEIADDVSRDTYTDKEGVEHVDHEVVQRSRLRVDTRKWYLSKLLPKVYSDKQVVEVLGPAGGPLQVTVTHQVVRAPEHVQPNRIAALADGNGNGDGQPS